MKKKIGYKVLEHSADILIEVEGNTLGELFRNAAVGMCQEVLDGTQYYDKHNKGLLQEVGGVIIDNNMEDELKGFLDGIKEQLYKRRFPAKIDFLGYCIYITWKPLKKKVTFCDEIKAVTLHMMKITRGEDGIWRTRVLFDV